MPGFGEFDVPIGARCASRDWFEVRKSGGDFVYPARMSLAGLAKVEV